MRIALLNQFYPPDLSPTAHSTSSLAEDRAARGDQVTVITSRGRYVEVAGGGGGDASSANPRVLRIPATGLGKGNLLFRLTDYGSFYLLATLRLLTLRRQDVVVSLTTPPFIALASVVYKLLHPSTRLVLWVQDVYPEMAERSEVIREGGLMSRVLRRLNRLLTSRLDRIVVLDRAMEELLSAHYGRDLPITVIPNWERASLFPAPAQTADAVEPWSEARRLGLDGKLVVLYLGNAGFGHRFDTVLDAAERLEEGGEEVVFLFIGGGAKWPWLRAQVEERGLGNVVILDYVPKEQTPAVMAAADAALVTMRRKVLGVISPSKIHSNLAMGLPLVYVGPPGGNVDQAIHDFDCGVRLEHGDVEGLAAFCRRLRNEPQERERLRANARRAFEEAYCDGQTLPAFDRLLRATNHRP